MQTEAEILNDVKCALYKRVQKETLLNMLYTKEYQKETVPNVFFTRQYQKEVLYSDI